MRRGPCAAAPGAIGVRACGGAVHGRKRRGDGRRRAARERRAAGRRCRRRSCTCAGRATDPVRCRRARSAERPDAAFGWTAGGRTSEARAGAAGRHWAGARRSGVCGVTGGVGAAGGAPPAEVCAGPPLGGGVSAATGARARAWPARPEAGSAAAVRRAAAMPRAAADAVVSGCGRRRRRSGRRRRRRRWRRRGAGCGGGGGGAEAAGAAGGARRRRRSGGGRRRGVRRGGGAVRCRAAAAVRPLAARPSGLLRFSVGTEFFPGLRHRRAARFAHAMRGLANCITVKAVVASSTRRRCVMMI